MSQIYKTMHDNEGHKAPFERCYECAVVYEEEKYNNPEYPIIPVLEGIVEQNEEGVRLLAKKQYNARGRVETWLWMKAEAMGFDLDHVHGKDDGEAPQGAKW